MPLYHIPPRMNNRGNADRAQKEFFTHSSIVSTKKEFTRNKHHVNPAHSSLNAQKMETLR